MSRPRRLAGISADYRSCPDCSERDAVSFTFGHLERRALDEPMKVSQATAVVSFARSERGLSRTRGCETCGGSGKILLETRAFPPFSRRRPRT